MCYAYKNAGGWILIFMLLAAGPALAQEALQNSLAGDTAAAARSKQMQSPQAQDYTFKKGDFRLLLLPSMGFEWNDNVNLADTNALEDYIVSPALGITASYPLSERTLIYLDVTAGYNWYLEHPDFSSFDLNSSSGTGLSFDIGIKDVTINLHDWISYVQVSGQNGTGPGTVNATVANTASFGTFQNTAGLSGVWDLNQVTLSLGYDHQNIIATSSQYNDINHSAEMLFARAGFRVHPKVTVGLEASAAYTSYDHNALNDSDAYTVGPYVEFRPSAFFSVTVRGGYSTYLFQNTSTNIQTSSQNSWYGSVSIRHQPRESVSYSIEAGRESQLGIQSDLVQDWYVRPNITWKIIKGLDINTTLFYEHGTQGVGSTGSLPGTANGTFDWYGGGLSLQHELTSRFSLGLNYQLTLRSSDTPNSGYTQNRVGLQLTYHPK